MGRGFEGPVQVGPHPWGTGGPWALVCNTRGVGRLDSESVRGCSLARGGSGWLHLASLGQAPELLNPGAPAWRGWSPVVLHPPPALPRGGGAGEVFSYTSSGGALFFLF